jgi:hypothetical protein
LHEIQASLPPSDELEHYLRQFVTLSSLNLVVSHIPLKPWLRPSQARAKPKPMTLAWPAILSGPSPLKPGQSPGIQAKPGPHITNLQIFPPFRGYHLKTTIKRELQALSTYTKEPTENVSTTHDTYKKESER